MKFGNTVRKVGNSHVITVPAFLIDSGVVREGEYLRVLILGDDE